MISAAIWNDPEYGGVAMVERRRWRVQLSDAPNRRKNVRSRAAAIDWCIEMGIPYVLVDPPKS